MLGRGVALVVGITGDTSGLGSALGKAGSEIKGFGGISLATAAKVTVIGAVAVTAAEAIFSMAQAADADRQEQAKLQAALEQAGAAQGDYNAIIDAAIAKGQDKAFSDTESRNALISLVTATKDAGTASELLAGAQDLARFAGVGLEQASDALAKAYAGNDGALRKLVPGLAKGATAMDTIKAATGRAKGQADIFAKSGQGIGIRVGDAFGELAETVGEVFLPIFDEIVPMLIPIIKQFGVLIKGVLPLLTPILKLMVKWIGFVIDVISTLVGWVVKLINWFLDLLRPIGQVIDALASLNPFGGLINSITGGGGTVTDTGGPSAPFSATFNIYGDPAVIEATIVRVLSDYNRRNGLPAFGIRR